MKKEKKQLQRLAWQTAWEKKLKGDLEFYFKRSPYMESLWLRFLIWIGARSKCCGARFEDYGYEKEWCSKCDKKDKQNEKSTR